MYTQMSHNHSAYGSMLSAPYHYDRSLRVSNQEYVTDSSPTTPPPSGTSSNDPYCWYSESAYTGISVPSQKSMQYPLLFSPVSNNTGGPRPVIPSKRAAQNRAAQRAFRLRKERYVKDLEQKAKLMEDMKAELDQLRKENQMLRETTSQLEKHISNTIKKEDRDESLLNNSSQQQQQQFQQHQQQQHQQQQQQQQKKRSSQHVSPIQTNFQPVSLRAPDQASFGSPTTSCSSASSFNNEPYWQQSTNQAVSPDFEPYECISNCDQRSEISPFVMVPPYPIMQHSNTIIMSRNY